MSNAIPPAAGGRRRVFLMRHGHVDYFQPGLTDPRTVSLTEEGEAQAAAAGEALSAVGIDVAAHSSLPRTRQTLEIVLARRKALPDVATLPGLEELRSGTVMASSREELAAWLAFSFDEAHLADASFLPGGETFAAAERRIVAELERFIVSGSWRSALVVAHEGVNRIVLGWACGGGLATIGAFEQDLGCINVIDFDLTPTGDGVAIERSIIKALNVTPYDYVKDGLPRTSLEHLFDIDFGRARPTQKPQAS
ncbi:MAG: histidine phosphatase family protein [Alphaproteobacteria bacterium]|nr:histidine phosphatase family protein [Alphaproteobacteria bacterium]